MAGCEPCSVCLYRGTPKCKPEHQMEMKIATTCPQFDPDPRVMMSDQSIREAIKDVRSK